MKTNVIMPANDIEAMKLTENKEERNPAYIGNPIEQRLNNKISETKTMMKQYKEVNGTSYDVRTNDKVINVLEKCRKDNTRIVLDYGDTTTGKSWNELHDITGRVGRSTGNVKIPILLYNSRSIGGGAILDHCIIGIKESKGGRVLYSYGA